MFVADDCRLDTAHRQRGIDGFLDACFGKREQRLHGVPRVTLSGPVQHGDSVGNIICCESPTAK